jgi:hypothetical protein
MNKRIQNNISQNSKYNNQFDTTFTSLQVMLHTPSYLIGMMCQCSSTIKFWDLILALHHHNKCTTTPHMKVDSSV